MRRRRRRFGDERGTDSAGTTPDATAPGISPAAGRRCTERMGIPLQSRRSGATAVVFKHCGLLDDEDPECTAKIAQLRVKIGMLESRIAFGLMNEKNMAISRHQVAEGLTCFESRGDLPPPVISSRRRTMRCDRFRRRASVPGMLWRPPGPARPTWPSVIKEALDKGSPLVFVRPDGAYQPDQRHGRPVRGLHDHRIIQSLAHQQRPFQIASAQTLIARNIRPKADVVVVDERTRS